MSWFETSVCYQIYPLGLCDASYENDGVLEHRILKLVDDGWIDHLKKLGANCVILNPVFQSISHGYDTTDYLKVDCRLGTNEDLRHVIDAFHEAGIKVLAQSARAGSTSTGAATTNMVTASPTRHGLACPIW